MKIMDKRHLAGQAANDAKHVESWLGMTNFHGPISRVVERVMRVFVWAARLNMIDVFRGSIKLKTDQEASEAFERLPQEASVAGLRDFDDWLCWLQEQAVTARWVFSKNGEHPPRDALAKWLRMPLEERAKRWLNRLVHDRGYVLSPRAVRDFFSAFWFDAFDSLKVPGIIFVRPREKLVAAIENDFAVLVGVFEPHRLALRLVGHWPDCAVNYGGRECDMGSECGLPLPRGAQVLAEVVKQDFRDQNPDRVAKKFAEILERAEAGKNRFGF